MDQYNNNGYQQPPVYQASSAPEDVSGATKEADSAFIMALIGFILSLTGYTFVTAVAALVLGIFANNKLKKAKELAESCGVELSGKATTAKIFSIIAIVIGCVSIVTMALSLVFFLLYLVFVVGMVGFFSY